MKPTETTPESVLAKKVRVRQKFVEEIIGFAEEIVRECGKELSYRQGSCHTSITAELKNVTGFSFFTDGAYSMMGGHGVKIWYRSDSETGEPKLVFDVEYWDIKDCKVGQFDPSPLWQRAIWRLVKKKTKTVERFRREKQEKKARDKEEYERQVKLQAANRKLQADALRLGLA